MLIQVTGILITILVVYLISTRLISKNNKDIVYEDEMDEIELKSIDEEGYKIDFILEKPFKHAELAKHIDELDISS